MRTNVLLIALLLICSTTSFSYAKEEKGNLKNATVVAERTTVNGSDLITCDLSKLDGDVSLPLSFFTEEMQIIKLDNKDEALVSGGATTITDNYILVRNDKQNPYKLFDRQGKFITSIGAYGKGPNEYLNVYDDCLDEKNKQVFILPWQSNKILRFNFKGEAMEQIELPARLPKGKFVVNGDEQTVLVMPLTFKGSDNNPIVAWKQDFKGNMINSLKSEYLAVNTRNEKGQFVGYNNEVMSGKNSNAFDCLIFTYALRVDTLYHYNDKGKLDAKFTLDFNDKPLKTHQYEELPNHFIGTIYGIKQISKNSSVTTINKKFIVDKKTLKGTYYNVYNDFLGGIPLDWVSFTNGYYVWNVEPGALIDALEKQLDENEDMSEKERKRLTDLLNSIDENDNNYVLCAKLKK